MPILSLDEFNGADDGTPMPPRTETPAARPEVLSAEDFANAPATPASAGPPAPGAAAPGEWGLTRQFGLAGTGANDLLATALGAPVDLATAAINKAPGFLNYLTFGATPTPGKPLIEAPIGGSQSLRDLLAGTLGRSEPQDPLERGVYGTGAAAMSVPLAGMLPVAAGLPAAASDFLTPASVPALARGTAIAAGGGAGGSAARDVAAKATDNPWLQTGADIVGGLLGGLATGGVLEVPRLAMQLLRPAFPKGQETIAGRILNQAAGPEAPPAEIVQEMAQGAPVGINPTLGDVTGNRGLQTIQRAVEAGTPEAGARAQTIASNNNQAIRSAFDDIGQPGARTPEQISQDAAQRLEAVRASEHAKASGAFQEVDPSGEAMVPTTVLHDRYDDYVTGLTASRRRFLPDDYAKLLGSFEEEEPLRELQDFASTLKTDARQAGSGASPNYNRANVLNGLHDALFPEGGPEGLLGADQAGIGADLRAARDQWRQYAQTYSEPSAVKNVLRPDGTPDSAALDKLLGSGQGQTERVGQFLRAAQGDPDLLQAGRDWFAAKMQAAGEVAAQDQQGAQFLNGNQLRKFRQANQPLIDSDLFGDQHRQAINDVVDAANMVQRTARAGTAGGSDTYRNLATDKYLHEFGMGPFARLLANVPALGGGGFGAALGGSMFGTPGAFIGGPIGAALGHKLSYAGPRANVVNLVGQAVHDPSRAADLMTRARTRPPTPSGFSLRDALAASLGTGVSGGP